MKIAIVTQRQGLFVARGFEEDNQNLNKESPTCSKDYLG